MDRNMGEIKELIYKIDQNMPHYPNGPFYRTHQRCKAMLYASDNNELGAIYCLKEAHAPGLRMKCIYRSEKNTRNSNPNSILSKDPDKNTRNSNPNSSLSKDHVQFSCIKNPVSSNIEEMLKQVEEMPEEWTLVQLTPAFNPEQEAGIRKGKNYTDAVHISVFNCGTKQPKPLMETVDAPVDKSTGDVIELKEEICSVLQTNRELLSPERSYTTQASKLSFLKERSNINLRLKNLVKNMQDLWIGKWRCLFAGKLYDKADKQHYNKALEYVLEDVDSKYLTERTMAIIRCVALSSGLMRTIDIKRVLESCLPNCNTAKLSKKIESACKDFYKMKRHPVILIIDESLDVFPWEMIDILQDQPVTRMPSLHFTYALFKEYENSIRNGLKDDIDPNKGKFMINPDLDLVNMEKRLVSFFKYWLPGWSGLVAKKPTPKEFEEMLQEASIFCYSGHGNGSQFISSDLIQKIRVNSVICLFGCSSSSYISLGPKVEMCGAHQMYLLACSPCLVGNLWTVTDTDTDILSTHFWSLWLPNKKAKHNWGAIDMKKWQSNGQVVPKLSATTDNIVFEPELLRALSIAKKSASQYLTRAACVVRGIPVKISTE